VNLRRSLAPALWGIRAYWGTATLLAMTAAAALGALWPVTALVAPRATTRLGLPPWRGGDLGMAWSTLAWSPTVTRHAALVLLFQLLLGVAIGVLVTAGITLMSISVARASARAPELSLRRAVGASRQQLFTSALLEAGAAAAAALLVGGVAGRMVARSAISAWAGSVTAPSHVPSIVAALAALAGIFLGAILPLAFPRRTSPLPQPGGRSLRLAVPALQLGLSLTALTAAALLRRQAGPLETRDQAATTAGQVLQVTAPEGPPGVRAAQYARVLDGFDARRTSDTVSLSSPGTLVGLGMVDVVITDCGRCAQGGLPLPLHPVPATHYLVSADTFRVLGLAVVAGRGIAAADRWNTARVAVVNRSLATRHFQQGQAVGRKILIDRTRADWYTVVGIVEDQRPVGFGAGLQPPFAVYLSVLQHPARAVDLFVHRSGGIGLTALDRALRDRLRAAVTLPVSGAQLLTGELAPLRWFGRMFGMEGWVILTVATLGVFVVMRLWVTSLSYELGLRRSVGARRRDLLRFVLLRAAGVAAGGVAIGLWVGLFVWGALATVVAGLPQWDMALALHIAPLLVGAAFGGALHPAWQASRAAPTELVKAGI
jgi:putative ABC transport system permease protein